MTAAQQASPDVLKGWIDEGRVDTVILGFCDMQGRLVGKRFTADHFVTIQEKGTHFCDYLLGTDMEMNTPEGFDVVGWDKGYGDWTAKPDWGTLRLIPWLEKSALILADVVDEEGALVEIAPRSVLKRQLDRASKMGFELQLASELEFYLIRETYEEAWRKGYEGLNLGGHYNEDYHLLQGTRNESVYRVFREQLMKAGIPVECTKGEAGIGQHEINVRYGPALESADRHVLLKHGMKEMAIQQGVAVTFMAKPDHGWTGSSCHIHVSLKNREQGQNAFYDPAEERGMSRTMRHFLAGVIRHMRETAILFAPNVNSYKRYITASWAPTNIVWGWDNRTCGLRIVGRGQSLRIENRFPGADANPYLAYAALIASGLEGIEQSYELEEACDGNGYDRSGTERLPASLNEAIVAFAESKFVQKALGPAVASHYLHVAKVEQQAFERVVTNWEKQRYFERI
ncbi:glutamine synthetase family protein [Lihuaxuella thermophila]|uniref:Glutamine synthetase n=1 Tax=Lihuaxuella thermophila TaxID=1173111 RepID=A0A1H8AT85_9BACL|nr:glutamine synthetase family protein [Lihuaxuella thermophila]SEM73930.1 glutamine synthetase [Lihuaxuella thermophila]